MIALKKRRVEPLYQISQVLNLTLSYKIQFYHLLHTNFVDYLTIIFIIIGDEDADERYVLDPVGSEKATPIIKGGVIDDSI